MAHLNDKHVALFFFNGILYSKEQGSSRLQKIDNFRCQFQRTGPFLRINRDR